MIQFFICLAVFIKLTVPAFGGAKSIANVTESESSVARTSVYHSDFEISGQTGNYKNPFLGDVSDFKKVKEKPGGASRGYIASRGGKNYMLKAATGYQNPVSSGYFYHGYHDAQVSEVITSRIFKIVLGDSYAPNTYLLTDRHNIFDHPHQEFRSIFASEIVEGATDYGHFQKIINSNDQTEKRELTKIFTLASILDVVDFKSDHIMKKHGRYFLIDSESTFFNGDFWPSALGSSGFQLSEYDETAIRDTIEKFSRFDDQQIDSLLQPFAQISTHLPAIKRRLKIARDNMKKILVFMDENDWRLH